MGQSIGLKPEQIDSVVIGNVLNASSPDAPYLARHVALKCGLPVPTPAYIDTVIIASEDAVTKHGLTPLARIVGYGVSGCEPTIMGIGPVPAIGAMLEKTGVSLGEVD